ncbi:MAG: hypothetical protein M1825_002531 [Sarcosagium campestre]|nr:MAG: hypothetical protein M1825_002531 [Sarcosagium campestre]
MPRRPIAAPIRRGLQLTRAHRVTLVRICIQNASAYGHAKKWEFWEEVQFQFHEKTGKVHRNAQQTVEHMVRQHRRDIEQDDKTGREHVRDEEFTAVDSWIKRLDEVPEAKADLLWVQGQLKIKASTTPQQSEALMSGGPAKRKCPSESDSESNESSTPARQTSATSIASRYRRQRKRRRTNNPADQHDDIMDFIKTFLSEFAKKPASIPANDKRLMKIEWMATLGKTLLHADQELAKLRENPMITKQVLAKNNEMKHEVTKCCQDIRRLFSNVDLVHDSRRGK